MNIEKFFKAIKTGDLSTVRQALESGMSPNAIRAGQNALDVACFHGHDAIVNLLLNPPPVKTPDVAAEVVVDLENPVCIVGYSSIFPGSGSTPDEYWQTLSGDHHKMSEVPAERWSMDEFYSLDKKVPGKMYTRRGGFIDHSPYLFDADFFKIVPKEAEMMDPQQRLMLEAAWYALEHAGINPHDLKEQLASVYCGIMTHDYIDMLIQSGIEHNNFIGTGNGASVLSGRVSYFLGLQGPCMTVDTACSSSLVTTHLAMRSLQNGECDLALSGGVNAMLAPGVTINCCKAHMLAEDGVCKSFSDQADGYGRGEGAGMLVLKRYKDALRDGNTIHAIIRGSAVNQDGATSGLTVPNKQAQVKVIRKALETAGLSPDAIDFVEAHGTGTLLGDPIEMNALKEVFASRSAKQPVFINSVKSFVGHLEAAAGVAGIIRILESFKHQILTALPIQGAINPKIQLDENLSILQYKTEWKVQDDRVRRAGISSFGFSGTNAHMILEEPPQYPLALAQKLEAQWADEHTPAPKRSTIDNEEQLLTLSAKDEKALAQMVEQYIALLEDMPSDDPNVWLDAAYSSQTGRAHFAHRLSIQAASINDCLRELKQILPSTLSKKASKTVIQVIMSDLACVDLSSLQQRYQNDAIFNALCHTLTVEVPSDYIQPALNCLARQSESLHEWQIQTAKLVAMYAMFLRYQRIGVRGSQLISQGAGHFLAAVIDGRLSLTNMLKLFKAHSLHDESLYHEVADSVVVYSSNGYWEVASLNLCENLYRSELTDQRVSSTLVVPLNLGSQTSILNSLSAIYLAGYDLNWRNVWQGSIRQFIQLPLYPFQRKHHRFEAKLAPVQAFQQRAVTEEPFVGGYAPMWQPFALAQQGNALAASSRPILVMLSVRQWHDISFMTALRQTLSQSHLSIIYLREGAKVKEDQTYAISFDQAEDWQWLGQQMLDDNVSRVVDLRYMDLQSEHAELTQLLLTRYLSKRLYQSQLFFQAWLGREIDQGYIACFPQGAVAEEIQLCYAGLQGQLRSIGLQHEKLSSVQIDTEQDSLMQALVDLIRHSVDGVAVKFEQKQWYEQKLTRVLTKKPPQSPQLFMAQDGVIITGGLGALGLTMARWHAEKGVKHIALVARRPPDDQQASQIEAIARQYSVLIKAYQADVINSDQLTQVINQISKTFTIRDVFHLAGKATIKRFELLTEQDYQDSLSAKVLGAVNLRNALLTLSYWPKQVVLFSSVASLLPEMGQITYAASNRMLDGLAMSTHLTDRPIRTINWGLWGAAGVGTNSEFVKRIRKGSDALNEAETKVWLDTILSASATQIAVLKIDWSVYQKHLTKAEKSYASSLLSASQAKAASAPTVPNYRGELLSLSEPERHARVMSLVKQAIAESSGKAMDALWLKTTFEEELNLDSNLMIEIKDLLQERMGDDEKPYAATLLNDYESVGALINYLLADLAQSTPSAKEAETPTDYIRQLVSHGEVQVKIKPLKKISVPQEPALILIHTIMGSVFFYKALIEHIQYAGSIYGIDNPYFSNLAVKYNSIDEMARAYAEKIKMQFAGQPIRLAGLSFAGAVAYEVAQQLIDLGMEVESILMFDTAMPGAGDLTLPQTQRQYVMGEIAEDINEYYQAEIDNNQRILNAYRPGMPKNELRVILFKARSRDSVNRSLPSLNDICNGWLTLFCPEVYSIPGSHFSLFDRAYVTTTVQTMRYAYGETSYFVGKQLQADTARNQEKLFLQAAKNGDSYLVLRLLKAGVDPMVTDESGHHAAYFSAENDDLCSLAWIHYYAKKQLLIPSLFEWAIKGKALKTMSYLVEHGDDVELKEPDATLVMDTNKKQALILQVMSRPYQQREWMEILAAHNDSAKGTRPPSAMDILPPPKLESKGDEVKESLFNLMTVNKILCDKFKYEVVTKLSKGSPKKPALFMLHAASGLALPYSNLEDLDFGTVYGISNPYFGYHDQPGFASIEEMARHYIARMKQIQPEGPYYLAGWSLGGIVSQAIASILEERGEKVGMVIMIDSVNHLGKPYRQDSERAAIEKNLEENHRVASYVGMKEAIMKCYLNTSKMLRTYQAKPCATRVFLLKADEHETTLMQDVGELVQWRHTVLVDPFSGWGNLLPNFEIQSVQGGHNKLFDRDYISGVHTLLKAILATVRSDRSIDVSLSQRWGMNLVKAIRRDDSRMIDLLLQQPSDDYSYKDEQGNLLDAIVAKGKVDLLEKLSKPALMWLQTSTGNKASDIALEFGLIDLFNALEQAISASFGKSTQSFFRQSRPTSDSHSQHQSFGLQ